MFQRMFSMMRTFALAGVISLAGFIASPASAYTQQEIDAQVLAVNAASDAAAAAEAAWNDYMAYWEPETYSLANVYDTLINGCGPVNHTSNGPSQSEYLDAQQCREDYQREFEQRLNDGWAEEDALEADYYAKRDEFIAAQMLLTHMLQS